MMVRASHFWGLRHVRTVVNRALAIRDRTVPKLAERHVLEVAGAAGPLEARLYRPLGVAADAPLLLFFHGGGFVVSGLDTHEALCIRLGSAGCFRVLSASYRLAPEAKFPAQLDDALAVTRWVLEDGGPRVSLPGRLAIGGDSAGAYLAASVAAAIESAAPGAISAQLLLYPLVQLDEATWLATLLKESRAVGWAAIRYINAQLAGGQGAPPSLLSLRLANVPYLIAAGGVLDPCKSDAIALADKLRAEGREVIWRDYPGQIHGFGNLSAPISHSARKAVAEIGELLGRMLA